MAVIKLLKPCNDVKMSFTKFLIQFKNSTTGLMAIGIFSTLFICGGYRILIKPEMDKRHRREAEAFAHFIFEQELHRPIEPQQTMQ